MASTPVDPSYYPYTYDYRSYVPIVSHTENLYEGQQLVYILILRRAYINPQTELLKVFNSLFNSPLATYAISAATGTVDVAHHHRAQMTLDEWEQMWAQQHAYGRDEQAMKDALVRLQHRVDYKCVVNVGGWGKKRLLRGSPGAYGVVQRTIRAAAERVDVVLSKKVG
ncbi:MAG: hypothetical protein ASARMPREDX12_006565 [Alectoria sarmentosa]|nr:MAG: hypothetical protein ASARMPREDX12_006565 [Alectoria sarmentosa]